MKAEPKIYEYMMDILSGSMIIISDMHVMTYVEHDHVYVYMDMRMIYVYGESSHMHVYALYIYIK